MRRKQISCHTPLAVTVVKQIFSISPGGASQTNQTHTVFFQVNPVVLGFDRSWGNGSVHETNPNVTEKVDRLPYFHGLQTTGTSISISLDVSFYLS